MGGGNLRENLWKNGILLIIHMIKFLFVLYYFIPLFTLSQSVKTEDTNPECLPEKEFKLTVKRIAPGEIKFPFSSIEIIDNRFDTSKLGYVPIHQIIANKKKVGRKIVFSQGVGIGLEKYYNEYYQNAFSKSEIKLVIVLKKFWFSGIDNEKNQEIDISKNNKARSFLYCKWEYYLKKNGDFFPVKRIDTVVNGVEFEAEINTEKQYGSEKKIFKLILNGLIEIIDFNKALAQLDKLPRKTLLEVQQYNASYFNIPVLLDSVVNKGVFLSFNEFKNNKPSIISFKEKQIRLRGGQYQYYLEDDHGNRILNYWGYNTGTDLKIGKYINEKLYRKNNSFEFFLKHQYIVVNENIIGNNEYKEKEVWIPYQIDMETGGIY